MVNQMVISSEIEWIGYEKEQCMLQVEFLSGRVYQYSPVSEPVFESFLGATSHGQYFEDHIKGRFPYRRVR